jgi:hypothetical protein
MQRPQESNPLFSDLYHSASTNYVTTVFCSNGKYTSAEIYVNSLKAKSDLHLHINMQTAMHKVLQDTHLDCLERLRRRAALSKAAPAIYFSGALHKHII